MPKQGPKLGRINVRMDAELLDLYQQIADATPGVTRAELMRNVLEQAALHLRALPALVQAVVSGAEGAEGRYMEAAEGLVTEMQRANAEMRAEMEGTGDGTAAAGDSVGGVAR